MLRCLAHQYSLESDGTYRRYREVLVTGLRDAAESAGIAVSDFDVFIDAWPHFQVFPDVVPAVEELRNNGWRVGILTNCDDDLFGMTRQARGFPIDEVVTAEQVRSYKPALAHFREFRDRVQAADDSWVHVANSWVADIEPASRINLSRIWVNRDGDPYDPSLADAVLPDFHDLTLRSKRSVPDQTASRAGLAFTRGIGEHIALTNTAGIVILNVSSTVSIGEGMRSQGDEPAAGTPAAMRWLHGQLTWERALKEFRREADRVPRDEIAHCRSAGEAARMLSIERLPAAS